MPRKNNGWGNPDSFYFKEFKTVSEAPAFGAAGYYPSDRRYGSSVTRTVIEKYDMDSDWAKWRKGYEYYVKSAWEDLSVENPYFFIGNRLQETDPNDPAPGEQYTKALLESVLYQGTSYELKTSFSGWEFPTSEGDTNCHYVAKRVPDTSDPSNTDLGRVTEVWNNESLYADQKANREIWVKGQPSTKSRLLLQMQGERLTDGETEATLKMLLTEDNKPAVYKGKTFPDDSESESGVELQATIVELSIPLDLIQEGTQTAGVEYTVGQGLKKFKATRNGLSADINPISLIGNIIYVPDFFIEKPISDVSAQVWADSDEYFGTTLRDNLNGASVYCLDPGVETLPPTMYDITQLPTLFTATNCDIQIEGTYIFQKKQYNRFFEGNYVTSDLVAEEVVDLSYAVLPFTIESAYIKNGFLEIKSVKFASEIKMYPALTENATLVFTDYSFCKYTKEEDEQVKMYIDVQPWQDEVFTNGEPLKPAVTYTCSCPDHSHSLLAAPQTTEDYDRRKQNRQRRYPLPSVMGLDRWEGLGVEIASGRVASWETEEHRLGLRLCKHAIAARFIDNINLIEPSSYPSLESRDRFERKIEAEIDRLADNFNLSYRRSKISISEIVFALAQGLNLDGIETAYVLTIAN